MLRKSGRSLGSEEVTAAVVALVLLSLLFAGCRDRSSDFQLNLNAPELEGRTVSVNGGVAVPVERIQWDWGDGSVDRHRFFPAHHQYAAPGTYAVTVTVFDADNRTAAKTARVTVQ